MGSNREVCDPTSLPDNHISMPEAAQESKERFEGDEVGNSTADSSFKAEEGARTEEAAPAPPKVEYSENGNNTTSPSGETGSPSADGPNSSSAERSATQLGESSAKASERVSNSTEHEDTSKQLSTEEPDTSVDGKRRTGDAPGSEPEAKRAKTEEGGAELSALEIAQQAAERARIPMLPELDPNELPPPGTGLPKHQHKYALSAIRAIKRLKDAAPFLVPVDPDRQGVPHYFDYIKQPMDLGTMETKLVDGKCDSIKSIVDDFNLVVSNCIVFNGEHALISKMALSIAQSFKKQLSNMPTFDATRKGSQAAAAAAAPSTASASPAATPGHSAAVNGDEDAIMHDDHVGKRSSTTTSIVGPNGLPTIRRKSTIDGRPKREVRPPRQHGYVGSGTGEGRPRNKKYASELRFAGQILREMQGRKLEAVSFPFLQPVDPIEQGVPHYFNIIKEPMDLSTIQKKLNEGIYYNGDEFESDIRLMFRNSFTFNPEGTPVNVMGHKLEAYFDSRWIERPIPGAHAAEDSDASDVDDDYAESGMVNPAIDVLEEQLKLIKKQLKRLKKEALAEYFKRGNRRAGGSKRQRPSNGGAGTSGHSAKPLPTEMTYEMKRELRDKIDRLPEKKIRTVLAIIQESMPDLGNNGQDEIELEVDSLDTRTLLRLYSYAVLGRRDEPGSGAGGAGGSTAGSPGAVSATHADLESTSASGKRRSKPLSEEEHVRKIAEIESKIKEFDNVRGSSPSTTLPHASADSGTLPANANADSESSDDEHLDSDDSSSEEE